MSFTRKTLRAVDEGMLRSRCDSGTVHVKNAEQSFAQQAWHVEKLEERCLVHLLAGTAGREIYSARMT